MNKLVLGALALSLTGGCTEGEKTVGVPDVREVREEVLACGGDQACLGLSELILAEVGNATGSIPSVTDECRFALAENVAGCMAKFDDEGALDYEDKCISATAENIGSICGE